jgi:three-Cys-motif partner protein
MRRKLGQGQALLSRALHRCDSSSQGEISKACRESTGGGAAFVDLFAGPGRCRLRESGQIINGSPLIALANAKAPFTKVILCELDDENVAALQARTASATGIKIIRGDCNAVIDDVIAETPPYGLNVALLDPFRAGDLQFTTVAKLAAVRRMDLIIHYPTMDLKRNVGRDRRTANAFVGSDAAGGIAAPAEVAGGIEKLKTNLVAYGYTGKQVRSIPIRNTKGNILYHLVFASKDSKGDSIWNSIVKRESGGQGNLF